MYTIKYQPFLNLNRIKLLNEKIIYLCKNNFYDKKTRNTY